MCSSGMSTGVHKQLQGSLFKLFPLCNVFLVPWGSTLVTPLPSSVSGQRPSSWRTEEKSNKDSPLSLGITAQRERAKFPFYRILAPAHLLLSVQILGALGHEKMERRKEQRISTLSLTLEPLSCSSCQK